MKITIGGDPGSGKSSVVRLLAKKYGLKYYDIGGLRRKMATDKGLTIDELNKIGEKEGWTDEEVDEYQKEIGEKEDNFIIAGRLSWFFIKDSIKIYIKVDENVAAERIFKHNRDSERKYKDIEDVKKEIRCRLTSDKARYDRLYGVNPYDSSHFDLVIDTTNLNEKEVGEAVEKAVKSVAGKSI